MKLRIRDEHYETDELTIDELVALKFDVDASTITIDAQLAQAKSHRYETGQYADSEWFQSATYARRMLGQDSQKLQMEIGKRRRAERRKRNAADHFVDVCRERMSAEVFMAVMHEAQSRVRHADLQSEGGDPDADAP